MSSRRRERVQSLLRDTVSEVILREVSDPRMGFVTVTRAEVSPDLKTARVYVSIIGDEGEISKTFAGLEHAAGYVRKRLGETMELRYTPKIHFILDDSVKKSVRITELLRRIREESGQDEGEDDGDESDET